MSAENVAEEEHRAGVEENTAKSSSSCSYVLVRNIPKAFRSSQLRRFFSQFVETGRFQCFHYRHRPEIKLSQGQDEGQGRSRATRCCLIRLSSASATVLFARYHGQHWTDDQGLDMDAKCLLQRVKMADDDEQTKEPEADATETSGSKNETDETSTSTPRQVSLSDVSQMSELRPPGVMPRGNVGTPTRHFLEAIQECRLPAKIIKQLGLEFPRQRRRRQYGSVPFEYEDKPRPKMFLSRGVHARLDKHGPRSEPAKAESSSDDDDDTGEEWERHTSLHDDVAARRADPEDVSAQPGTKERLFEEEMEVTWDKGSSGLVFYTDAQVWKEMEGDFDERTTDDWDVDMSVYYEDGAGDKDAKDSLAMRRSNQYRQNQNLKSVFRPRAEKKQTTRKRRQEEASGSDEKIGRFERHTKGFGRKLMESQGWRDGQGLGSASEGLADALGNEGQTDRSGLGFRGEALPRFVVPQQKTAAGPSRERKTIRDVIISTCYDDKKKIDPHEPLKRRNPQNYLSHR